MMGAEWNIEWYVLVLALVDRPISGEKLEKQFKERFPEEEFAKRLRLWDMIMDLISHLPEGTIKTGDGIIGLTDKGQKLLRNDELLRFIYEQLAKLYGDEEG